MAMTNAERQRRYRDKRRESGDSRINTAVSSGAHACLKRIARSRGINEREALEAILQEAGQTDNHLPAKANGYHAFRQAIIDNGVLKTQRGYIRDGYRDKQVRAWFKQLETEGLIRKERQNYILTSISQ